MWRKLRRGDGKRRRLVILEGRKGAVKHSRKGLNHIIEKKKSVRDDETKLYLRPLCEGNMEVDTGGNADL